MSPAIDCRYVNLWIDGKGLVSVTSRFILEPVSRSSWPGYGRVSLAHERVPLLLRVAYASFTDMPSGQATIEASSPRIVLPVYNKKSTLPRQLHSSPLSIYEWWSDTAFKFKFTIV